LVADIRGPDKVRCAFHISMAKMNVQSDVASYRLGILPNDTRCSGYYGLHIAHLVNWCQSFLTTISALFYARALSRPVSRNTYTSFPDLKCNICSLIYSVLTDVAPC
jgi:hypothetical protein